MIIVVLNHSFKDARIGERQSIGIYGGKLEIPNNEAGDVEKRQDVGIYGGKT